MEIACNDGSQLNQFKALDWQTFGADPAANIVELAREEGHKVKVGFWGVDDFTDILPPELDVILAKMRRRYNSELYRNKILKIYNEIPNVSIGVDVIVGFPDETDIEFKKSMNFIKDLPVSYLHVFSYSERENTKALLLKNPVDKHKRSERSKILRMLSSKLQRNFYLKSLGTTKNLSLIHI